MADKTHSIFVCLYIDADVESPDFQTCVIHMPEIHLDSSLRPAFFQTDF